MMNIYNNEKQIFDDPIIRSGNKDHRNNFNNIFATEDQPIRHVKKDYLAKEFYPRDTSANLVTITKIENLEAKLWRNEKGKLTVNLAMDSDQGRVNAQWSSEKASIKLFGRNELRKDWTARGKWFKRAKNEFQDLRDTFDGLCAVVPGDVADIISANVPGVQHDLDTSKEIKLTAFYANKINLKFKVNEVGKHVSIDRAGLSLSVINGRYHHVCIKIQDQEYKFWFHKRDKTGKSTSRMIGYYSK